MIKINHKWNNLFIVDPLPMTCHFSENISLWSPIILQMSRVYNNCEAANAIPPIINTSSQQEPSNIEPLIHNLPASLQSVAFVTDLTLPEHPLGSVSKKRNEARFHVPDGCLSDLNRRHHHRHPHRWESIASEFLPRDSGSNTSKGYGF